MVAGVFAWEEGDWVRISATDGKLDIIQNDQVGPIYSWIAMIEKGTFDILVDPVKGSYDVTITNEVGGPIVIGDTIILYNGDIQYDAKVLNRVGDLLTLDRFWAMDVVATYLHGVFGSTNLNVNGSGAPIKAVIKNYMTATTIDITQIDFMLSHAVDFSFDGFAGIVGGLTRGVQFISSYVNDTIRRLGYNFKTNGSIGIRVDTHEHVTKVGGSAYGMLGKKYFGPSPYLGTVIRLSYGQADAIEIWIQDDLTTLPIFRICAEASKVL